jgi:hypothetical protein
MIQLRESSTREPHPHARAAFPRSFRDTPSGTQKLRALSASAGQFGYHRRGGEQWLDPFTAAWNRLNHQRTARLFSIELRQRREAGLFQGVNHLAQSGPRQGLRREPVVLVPIQMPGIPCGIRKRLLASVR